MKIIKYVDESQEEGRVELDRFPDRCPVCDHSVEVHLVYAYGITRLGHYSPDLQVVFRCPRQDCQKLFFGFYRDPWPTHRGVGEPILHFQRLGLIEAVDPVKFEEPIGTISPRFGVIYNQALVAEESGLHEICGGGYGKALEVLIKDYLISLNPEGEKEIRQNKKLGQLISRIKDENIQIVADRAAWLRNDEVHYDRVWEEKDVQDLKTLIELTTHHIRSFELTKKYKVEMPDPKDSDKKQETK